MEAVVIGAIICELELSFVLSEFNLVDEGTDCNQRPEI